MSRGRTILERRYVPAGSLIMKKGEPGNSAYLVQSGSVRVFLDKEDGSRQSLAVLGMGQIFGEMALIFDEPRSASVEAIEDCNLIIVTRETFKKKMERSDATIQSVIKMLIERMRKANRRVVGSAGQAGDLVEAIDRAYHEAMEHIPANKRREFREAMQPKIQDVMHVMESFQKELKD